MLSFLCFTLLLVSTPAYAQWNDDAALNTLIADKGGEQIQPKIANHPEGGAYISWLDSASGGYDVFLQRIDAEGNLLWDAEGVLIAERGFSSTEDYGLSVDSDGNALLAFRDDRQGGVRATAQRVDAEGNLLWGEAGKDITTGAEFVAAPGIAALSNGSSIAAFTSDAGTRLVKLDSEGEMVWQQTEAADVPLALSDIHASDAEDESGKFIALFRSFGPPTVPGLLFTQKYEASGTPLWNEGTPIELMETGTLQLGYFPDFVPDGSGGMAVGWYINEPLEAYVQHISAAGELRFESGGKTVSTIPDRARTGPTLLYDVPSDDIYAFWPESNSTQSQFGMGGQRFDVNGNRLWDEEGISFKPLGGNQFGSIVLDMQEDGLIIGYGEGIGFGNSVFRAAKLDDDGQQVWAEGETVLADAPAGRSRLSSIALSGQELAYVWEDSRNTSAGVYAQNLNADGSLGSPEEEPEPVQEVVFTVDMSVQQLNGTFQPETGDEVLLRGGFNDWGAEGDVSMSAGEDEIYTLSLPIEGEAGTTFEYKFYIEAGDGRALPNDGREGDVGPGENGNRVLTLTDDEVQELPLVFFNNDEEHDTSTESPEQPRALKLHQNYPNPFNPATTITYELPESGLVQLRVFNVQGQEVARLVNGRQQAGVYRISFDASAMASGVYIYRLEAADAGVALTRKMTLVK